MPASAEVRIRGFLETAGCEVNGPNAWDPQIHDPNVYDRIVRDGTLGVGETYMDGLWACEAIDQLVDRVGKAGSAITQLGFKNLARGAAKATILNLQNRTRAIGNARAHYNIGNDIYAAMLGQTMAYSCAYWEDYGGPAGANTLDKAQEAKFELICHKLGLKEGMRVLEIGCGWGGFLTHAVNKYGVTGVGVTPADKQTDYIRDKKLPFELREEDWRAIDDGPYDRVLSIGMFEHVGPKNYADYFKLTRHLLKDDGLNFVHTIGSDKTRYLGDPWVQEYIFPNGHIPSDEQLVDSSKKQFSVADMHEMGQNYDPTLMAWNDNFQAAWPELSQIVGPDGKPKYDERFKRMWEFYLLSCAGAFRNGKNRLFQVVYRPNGAAPGYVSVR